MVMLIILCGVMVSLVYLHVKVYQVVHFKYVQFLVCYLHLNRAV